MVVWYSLWLHGRQQVQKVRSHQWVLSCPPHPEVRGLPEVQSYPEKANREVKNAAVTNSVCRGVSVWWYFQLKQDQDLNLQALLWDQHLPLHPECQDLPKTDADKQRQLMKGSAIKFPNICKGFHLST